MELREAIGMTIGRERRVRLWRRWSRKEEFLVENNRYVQGVICVILHILLVDHATIVVRLATLPKIAQEGVDELLH